MYEDIGFIYPLRNNPLLKYNVEAFMINDSPLNAIKLNPACPKTEYLIVMFGFG